MVRSIVLSGLITSHVVPALDQAYEQRTLHRDVSIGNIVLYRCRTGERRKGLLIDWEYACEADSEGRARDHYITVSISSILFLSLLTLL